MASYPFQMARTQKNKATAFHLGILKAKLAKFRRELLAPSKGGGAATGEGKNNSLLTLKKVLTSQSQETLELG